MDSFLDVTNTAPDATIEEILPPDAGRMIEGLRDTGYTFNTALADIIDNSIDACADMVDVALLMDEFGDIRISVADNGCGMDRDTLRQAMKYGAPAKPDPRRLGKFGLGLKTASTAFCRRLTVLTRGSGAEPILKATWDLDHVVNRHDWALLWPMPTEEETRLLDDIASGSSGTVVVWDKVDRLFSRAYKDQAGRSARKAFDKIVDDFKWYAGMIFQRFLDVNDNRARNVRLLVNGIPVKQWDPFCVTEEQTEVFNASASTVETHDGRQIPFSLKAYVLPRREQFSSEEAATKAQIANKLQGLYIYRENRLIHPHDWLGMYTQEPHFSLLRVEFSFSHDLDEAFRVDIKKSKIELDETLRDFIQKNFLPAVRNAAEQRYRHGTKSKVTKLSKSAHADSDRNIASKADDLLMAKVEIVDQDTGEVQIQNKLGVIKLKLNLQPTYDGQLFIHPVESIDDGLLWEPTLTESHHAVRINTGHPYYQKVYVPNLSSGVTIQGMDSLLWALCEAELGTVSEATKKHFSDLRYEISRLLRKLVNDLPEPDLAANE